MPCPSPPSPPTPPLRRLIIIRMIGITAGCIIHLAITLVLLFYLYHCYERGGLWKEREPPHETVNREKRCDLFFQIVFKRIRKLQRAQPKPWPPKFSLEAKRGSCHRSTSSCILNYGIGWTQILS